MGSTLFERLGGMEAIVAAADLFYQKVLADERVRHFFEETDMEKQTDKMVGFLTRAFDGPDEYKGRDLRTAHAQLVAEQGLNDSHFDAVVELLRETLIELGVEDKLIQEVMAITESTRNEVLDR